MKLRTHSGDDVKPPISGPDSCGTLTEKHFKEAVPSVIDVSPFASITYTRHFIDSLSALHMGFGRTTCAFDVVILLYYPLSVKL